MATNGRPRRKSTRPIAEKIRFIAVGDLARAGAFSGGEQNFPWAGLRYSFLNHLRTYRFRADFWPRNAKHWTHIPVEWTRCTFGGRRPWFRCSCGRRVAKLYWGGIFLGCRRCYDAIYECQRRGEKGRAYYQACKIRMRLGSEPSIRGAFPERPRRMWRRTYERLRREAEALERPLGRRFAHREPDYSRFSFF